MHTCIPSCINIHMYIQFLLAARCEDTLFVMHMINESTMLLPCDDPIHMCCFFQVHT
jgi:hypothetical protein